MKKFVFFLAALLLFPLAQSFAQEEPTKKVAILETVDREGHISYGIRLMLRSSLSYAITNTPGYEGYDRVDLESIVGEQSFQRTGMVSDEQIKKLGEMTGASYILVAEAAKVDATHIFITAKILNVETARLEATANVQTLTEAKEIEEGCKELAAMLLGTEPEESSEPESVEATAEKNSVQNMWDDLVAKHKAKQEARKTNADADVQARSNRNQYSYVADYGRQVPDGIYPGMKYRQYKKYYKASDYVSMPQDRYSPVVGGVCSFLIPGLGQMINGDVGRGFKFFGCAAASSLVMIIGSSIYTPVTDYYSSGNYSYSNTYYQLSTGGTILVLVGVAGMLATDIWAIIDGIQHAKIKNMYMRDIRGLSSLDIRLNPYIASVAGAGGHGVSPAVGLSLNVTF